MRSHCSSPLIQNNQFTNSEGNIYVIGCSAASMVNNTIYSSYGNGIEIGKAFQSSDENNNEPYVANNVIHNLGTAYQRRTLQWHRHQSRDKRHSNKQQHLRRPDKPA